MVWHCGQAEHPERTRNAPSRYGQLVVRWPLLATAVIVPLSCVTPVPGGATRAESNAFGRARATSLSTPGGVDAEPNGERAATLQLKVNGEAIRAHEVWEGRHDSLAERARESTPAAYQEYVEQTAARLIKDKIAEVLLFQEASQRLPEDAKVRVDAYVDEEIRKTITSEHGGSQRRYERHLASRGQTLEDVRAKLRRRIIIAGYLEQEVRPKVAEPTRDELWAAFQAYAESARRPPRRRISLIDVRMTDRLPADVNEPTRQQLDTARAEALALMQSARAELHAGNAFHEVARRYSDGLHAPDGGAWGWVTQGNVRKRFEPAVEAAFQLEEGQVSDIIETTDGFFIVRCDEIDPGAEPDFQSMQPQLAERLSTAHYNGLVLELVSELSKKARFEPQDISTFHAAVVQAAPVPPQAATPSPASD